VNVRRTWFAWVVLALSAHVAFAATTAQAPRPARRPPSAPKPATPAKPTVPAPPKDDVTVFVERLVGHFSNEAQAPLRGITPGGSDRQSQDRLHVHVRRVVVPVLPGTVLYVQWNRDRSGGPIARQRLWAIASGGEDRLATMRVYGLRDPESHVDAIESPESLQTLEDEDVFVPADSCDLPVSRTGEAFLATTLPACPSAVAVPLSMTRFQARLRVTAEGFTYSEAGYRDPDFTPVFLLPKQGSYEFARVK
jgi:hypothetical protein